MLPHKLSPGVSTQNARTHRLPLPVLLARFPAILCAKKRWRLLVAFINHNFYCPEPLFQDFIAAVAHAQEALAIFCHEFLLALLSWFEDEYGFHRCEPQAHNSGLALRVELNVGMSVYANKRARLRAWGEIETRCFLHTGFDSLKIGLEFMKRNKKACCQQTCLFLQKPPALD